MSGADLSHVDTWLFDLDNTLYPLETGLGIDISERITGIVAVAAIAPISVLGTTGHELFLRS